jgi:hypothetical protein
MKKKHLALSLFAVLIAVGTPILWPSADVETPAVAVSTAPAASTTDTCAESSTTQAADAPDPARVPPGCCTSNCNVDKDCDRICGKGNCLCLASSNCCRRCTY